MVSNRKWFEVNVYKFLCFQLRVFAVKHTAGPRKKSKFRIHAFNLKAAAVQSKQAQTGNRLKKQKSANKKRPSWDTGHNDLEDESEFEKFHNFNSVCTKET